MNPASNLILVGPMGAGKTSVGRHLAGLLGLPLVDADGMGRAFPEGPQVSMHVAGLAPEPVFLADEHGNVVSLGERDGDWYERIVRSIVVAFGGQAFGADFVMPASIARGAVVHGTVSLALRLGRALRTGGLPALVEASGGFVLATGTVADVERRTTGGFARGVVTLVDEGTARVTVHVQNENLLVERDGRPLAIVPDLIVLVDDATGTAVPTERVRFGQRLSVVGIPCAPVWRTEGGLAVAGPAAFDHPHPYVPVEELVGDG